MEAQDLLGKDKFLGGLIKGKSDPYGFVRIGTQVFQSKVIHENLNPKWNEVYEVSERRRVAEGQRREALLCFIVFAFSGLYIRLHDTQSGDRAVR